jgi:hypothetical protein
VNAETGGGFSFGDPRFPTCCSKPVGCSNFAEACAFREHKWKRRNVQNHPHPIHPEAPTEEE